MYRTITGQTGPDAYLYEAAQITGAMQQLTHRFRALLTAAHAEHPELFDVPSDYCPSLSVALHAPQFIAYVHERRSRVTDATEATETSPQSEEEGRTDA